MVVPAPQITWKPSAKPGAKGKDSDWSSVSGRCWKATMGAAGPIWSAAGEAVCLLGMGSHRAPLLLTRPSELQRQTGKRYRWAPSLCPSSQGEGVAGTLDTAKPRGLSALRNTHGNATLYGVQTIFLRFVHKTFAERQLIPGCVLWA